jgi:multicomponent Na+:H+ antiporter subunit F
MLIGLFIILIRAIVGPTVYDRILATNAIGTKTILFVTLLGYISGRTEFIDMAIVYALITFITTIAILKFAEKGRLD